MSKHARFSPSSSKRWLNCPGSVALSLTVPEATPSEAALEGTKAHDFCERLLRIELREYSTKSEKERLIKNIYKEITDEEMLECVTGYVSFVLKVRAKFLEKQNGRYFEFVEERLKYSEDLYGTIDYGLVGDKSCVLIDFKYGQGVEVEALENPQLMCYALCVLQKYPTLENFHIFIYQPRIGDTPHERFDIDIRNLVKFEIKTKRAISNSLRIIKDGADVENLCEGD